MGPKKRKDDISLTKIILGICLIAVIAFGVHRAARWFKEDYVGGALEAAAPSELARAEEAFQAGNLVEARGILLPIVEKTRNDAISPQAGKRLFGEIMEQSLQKGLSGAMRDES